MVINKSANTDLFSNINEKNQISQHFLRFFIELEITELKKNTILVDYPFSLSVVPLLICVFKKISLVESFSFFLSPTFSETDETVNGNYIEVIK